MSCAANSNAERIVGYQILQPPTDGAALKFSSALNGLVWSSVGSGGDGPTGIAGMTGPAGQSTNGFTGCSGPIGLQGPTGANGAIGRNGPTGPQGPTGTIYVGTMATKAWYRFDPRYPILEPIPEVGNTFGYNVSYATRNNDPDTFARSYEIFFAETLTTSNYTVILSQCSDYLYYDPITTCLSYDPNLKSTTSLTIYSAGIANTNQTALPVAITALIVSN